MNINAADLAFVQRDILILSLLFQAAQIAVSAVRARSKGSVRNAQNHLDALSYYLSQVSTSELPALRENGTKSSTLGAVFPAIGFIERKTKELREQLASKCGN